MKMYKELSHSVHIPIVGFGTFRIPEGFETEQAVTKALEAGYRHIDTAKIYGNEADVGNAIRRSGIPRDQIFITTKLWNADQGYETTLKAIDESLEKLQLDYVDLYLVHWPTASISTDEAGNYLSNNKRKETWQAMEEIYKSGKARAIGVSNYTVKHLEEMEHYATIMPMVNQVELHPFLFKKDTVDYCNHNNIVIEAHSPLAPIADQKMIDQDISIIHALAEKYNKTPAQILLRWSIQHGFIPLVKSTHEDRMRENINIFDFVISESDMKLINSMDRRLYARRNPNGIL